MNKVKLGDVMTLHRGYDLPNARRIDGDVPIIGSSGVLGFHNVARLHDENVITGRCGTIGKVFYHDGSCWPLNTTLYVEDFHGNNARYIAYLLEAILGSPVINGGDKSTVPGVDRNALHAMEIPYTENRDEQELIANALSSIDDKIALNKKMMVELEDTARLIYDYWFTQFDFPDENGKPYRSSGGKMVYNETLKREIPEGWEAGTLSSLAAYGERSIDNPLLTTNTYVSTDNMLPNRGGVSESQYLPDAGSSSMFERHDILLSNIRPYFKKIWLADRVGGCCNDVLVLHPTNINDWAYLYWIMESDIFFAYDTAGAKGSKMPRGDKDHIMRYPFALPSAQLRASFAEQVSSLMTAEEKLQAESAQLTALRDWLLPMLMNGQVSISG